MGGGGVGGQASKRGANQESSEWIRTAPRRGRRQRVPAIQMMKISSHPFHFRPSTRNTFFSWTLKIILFSEMLLKFSPQKNSRILFYFSEGKLKNLMEYIWEYIIFYFLFGNYENSSISPCKNIIFKKSSQRNQNPSRYYYNSITNLKFQRKPKCHLSKSSYKNRPIIIIT